MPEQTGLSGDLVARSVCEHGHPPPLYLGGGWLITGHSAFDHRLKGPSLDRGAVDLRVDRTSYIGNSKVILMILSVLKTK